MVLASKIRRQVVLALYAVCVGMGASAQQADSDEQSLIALEKLTRTEVSTVSRQAEELFKSPAAVYVITSEQIHRSSAESIPELLRRIPGLEVQQIQANRWAISARGFNGIFADKMLMLIDGRTVYNEDFSGVYWDMNDIALDDIERLEVVRGPGGVMWGANAVNGVINIISKSAARTQGTNVSAWESTTSRDMSITYDGHFGDKVFYRVLLKEQLQLPLQMANGASAADGGHSLRGGERLDWKLTSRDELTLQSNIFRSRIDQIEYGALSALFQDKIHTSGGYIRGRWRHTGVRFDDELQICYDDENRDETMDHNRVGTYDVDYQQHDRINNVHELTWGLEERFIDDHYHGENIPVMHALHHDQLYSSFAQDAISLQPDVLTLTLGTKLLWLSSAHFDWQPSARLLWTPDTHHAYWTALSRAVRPPSVRDQDLNLFEPYLSQGQVQTQLDLRGNPNIQSEDVLSYEAGYRWKFNDRISTDVAGFLNDYKHLESDNELPPTMNSTGTMKTIPVTFDNDYRAHSQGIESALMFEPASSLRLRLSYSWMQARLRPNLNPALPIEADLDWNTPRNTFFALSNWKFHRGWVLDTMLFFNSQAKNSVSPFQQVNAPGYARLDSSISYSVGNDVVLRAGIRNAQSPRHLEFDPQNHYAAPSDPPRAYFVKLAWSF
ncbi:TonB-dependent receptor plug domain-containing protein [Telmatobacter bradus]|uniref:TonB-dependent receptor plug domain-containing protein n=1 Tax=Telmatobacter bradus TaxID=474953 RepID=UPI003B433289